MLCRKYLSRIVLLLGGLLLADSIYSDSAQAVTWDGSTDGTWSNGTNWVGNAAPLASDTAEFVDGGNGNTTLDLGSGVSIQVRRRQDGIYSRR